jgi:hypothetical protein
MYGRPLRRSTPPGSATAPIRRRWTQASANRGGTMNPDAPDESPPKAPTLEVEILGLRQRLAEVQAKSEDLRKEMDDLRRDRDHWRDLAKPAEADKAGPRTWFCGRALPNK